MRSYAKELYIDEYMDIIGDYKILLGYGISKEELIFFPKIKQILLNPCEEKKFRKPPMDLRAKTKLNKGDVFSIKIKPLSYRWGNTI